MKKTGLTIEQVNRILHDFKRVANVFYIIERRMVELKIEDDILKIGVELAKAEYDAIFGDIEGMLNGNGKKE